MFSFWPIYYDQVPMNGQGVEASRTVPRFATHCVETRGTVLAALIELQRTPEISKFCARAKLKIELQRTPEDLYIFYIPSVYIIFLSQS